MDGYTYYCEVSRDRSDYRAGVYSIVADRGINARWWPKLNQVITISDRVWKQGPRGGVRIIKSRIYDLHPMGYITKNERWMKQFAWVKLSAKSL